MRLPTFLVIGAMKAGTSLVHALLEEHPEVSLAANRKEVMFFDRHWERGLDWYAGHFEGAGPIRGEVTPGYLFDERAPERIRTVVPDAALVAVLRDPVARAYSQYCFWVKERAYAGTVDDFLSAHPNAIERGLYAQQLSRFEAPTPLIVLFEELVSDPVAQMQQIFAHIGVDDRFTPPSAGERRNASERPRWHQLYALGRRGIGWLYDHDLAWVVSGAKRLGLRRLFFRGGKTTFPAMGDATRARLTQHYAADILALEQRIERDLAQVWPSHPRNQS